MWSEVEFAEEDQDETALTSHFSLLRFNCIPFWLQMEPGKFQE